MSKRKDKKTESRRIKEVLKAQVSSGLGSQLQDKLASAVVDTGSNTSQPKRLSQRLNIKEIKKDLIKTFIFAVLFIAFLLIIKRQGLELNFGIYK